MNAIIRGSEWVRIEAGRQTERLRREAARYRSAAKNLQPGCESHRLWLERAIDAEKTIEVIASLKDAVEELRRETVNGRT